jgi:hypothetical protein
VPETGALASLPMAYRRTTFYDQAHAGQEATEEKRVEFGYETVKKT